jgi:hypothetical protein
MPELAQQRCHNHAQREAVVRCPGCGQYFCRECVAEHDDQMLCAVCLRKSTRIPLLERRWVAGLVCGGQCLLGALAACFFFYLLGERLLRLPSSFHEGTLWQVNWFEQ